MADSIVDDELWDGFHRVENMTWRELRDWLAWRRRLMNVGHDPLKPAS